jgi:CheY-like chemotaxis protein
MVEASIIKNEALPWNGWFTKDFDPLLASTLLRKLRAAIGNAAKVRLIYIEDNPKEAAWIRRILPADWQVKVYESKHQVEAALDRGEFDKVDCVLSDVMLPHGDEGIELAFTIRSLFPTLPIFMLTFREAPGLAA